MYPQATRDTRNARSTESGERQAEEWTGNAKRGKKGEKIANSWARIDKITFAK